MKTRPVYIAGGIRTPFVKSMGSYSDISTQELMIASLQALVKKFKLENQLVGDVALGAVITSPFNWNLSRECVLGTSLNPATPGYTLQRACGTSLEASLQIALKIANYQIEDGIAGGVDTNSDFPVMLPRSFSLKLTQLKQAKDFSSKLKALLAFRPSDLNPQYPGVVEPRTGLSMGQHTEKMVKEWQISREAQDELTLLSHQHGAKAYEEGFYDDLVLEYMGLKKTVFYEVMRLWKV